MAAPHRLPPAQRPLSRDLGKLTPLWGQLPSKISERSSLIAGPAHNKAAAAHWQSHHPSGPGTPLGLRPRPEDATPRRRARTGASPSVAAMTSTDAEVPST